jgi:hypothetical protein
VLPPDIGHEVPMELLGEIAGVGADAERVPWDGPTAPTSPPPRDGAPHEDPRLAPPAPHADWLPAVHAAQAERLRARRADEGRAAEGRV